MDDLNTQDAVATSLASLYGQTVYYTNKNMELHRRSENVSKDIKNK